jgi:hypothetical protein
MHSANDEAADSAAPFGGKPPPTQEGESAAAESILVEEQPI